MRLVLLIGLLWCSAAWACRCKAPPTTGDAYGRAVAVVRGEVTELTPVPSRRGARVQLRVKAAWKKKLPARLSVQSVDLCFFPFQKGEEYVVFLVQDGRDWVTSRCTGNRRLGESAADEALAWLQENGDRT